MSAFRAGVVALLLISVSGYVAYAGNPFADPFELRAVFTSAANLKQGAPVRIGGVAVGKVARVEPVGARGGARVTMDIEDDGLPLHRDARLKIRPRIFLEGNLFVDLQPGSPSAPELTDGAEVPVQQTATPVQFAELLGALQSDTRADLRRFLYEYSRALAGNGARGLNQTFRYGAGAYRFSAQVSQAARGARSDDLARLVSGQQRTAAALTRRERSLRELVPNLGDVSAALARQDRALEASLPALDGVLRVGRPALGSLNGSLPSVRALARDALPAVRSARPAIDANLPLLRQARLLMRERELRGLVRDLRPSVRDLVTLDQRQVRLLRQLRALSACQNNVLLPFARAPIPDPDFKAASGQPFYKETARGLVGLSGESRLADANSPLFHVNLGAGPLTIVQPGEDGSRTFGVATFPPLGVRPVRPPRRPGFRPDVPCETQEAPNLNALGGPADAKVVEASGTPRNATARRRTERQRRALDLLVGNLRRPRSGALGEDPLRATERQLRKKAGKP